MELIKDTVEGVLASWRKNKTGPCSADPQVILKKVLTKRQVEHIKFTYLRKGILGLCVDSSAWLYQMSMGKEKLLAKLRAKIEGLKEIRFFVGE